MAFATNQGTGGAFPAALQPTQTKELYQGNYLNFLDGSIGDTFAQQFLPDVYEKEVNKYGKRTVAGFLKMMSAEMPSTSDQIIWTEQGRLHTRYTGCTPNATITSANAGQSAGHVFNVSATQPGSSAHGTITDLSFRVGQTVMIQAQGSGTGNEANEANRGSGVNILKGIISQVSALTFTVHFYQPGRVTSDIGTGVAHTALVYGSEFAKGTSGMEQTIFPEYETFSNSPIIMKDHFALNGSDTSQVGWIEVTSENGATGYLWYIKAEHENRLRWEDYMEMSMLEAVQSENSNANAAGTPGTSVAAGNQSLRGTEGYFQALERRGNLYDSFATELGAANAEFAASASGQTPFDYILRNLDKQGQIEENMLYLNRDTSLAFDNFIARQNNYGGDAGVSWGLFNNAKDMALNFGFKGLRRGSYDFYKTDWKYLNDWSTRGGFADVSGTLIPAGSSTVYDEVAGANVKRPFLHVRYRSSEADNRKMKSWITGSVGGAYTNDIDEMRMHYLTERCLITQAPNNFFLFRG